MQTPRLEVCGRDCAGQLVMFHINGANDDFHCGGDSDAQGEFLIKYSVVYYFVQRDR